MKEASGLGAFVPFNPRILAVVETSESVGNDLKRLRLFAHTDYITGLYCIRSDVDHLAVDSDVLVEHELTGGRTAGSDAQTIYYIIQTAFEELQNCLLYTSDAADD